jgi:group I intron endonuclease
MVGIYKITSPTGKVYIGQSRDIEGRWKIHKWKGSRDNKDGKYPLYFSMNKYGVGTHTMEVIEECTFEELNIRERYWQDYYNVLKEGLNAVLQNTSGKPREYSKEIREIISAKSKRLVHTEESKKKISIASSKALKGRKKTEAHKKALSLAKTGVKRGPMSDDDKIKKSKAAKRQRAASRRPCDRCGKIYDKANMIKHLKGVHKE